MNTAMRMKMSIPNKSGRAHRFEKPRLLCLPGRVAVLARFPAIVRAVQVFGLRSTHPSVTTTTESISTVTEPPVPPGGSPASSIRCPLATAEATREQHRRDRGVAHTRALSSRSG